MIKFSVKAGEGTKLYNDEFDNIRDGVVFGKNCIVHSHVWIGENVKIGDNVKIQAFTFIPEGVTIEDDVFIGPRVTFTNDPNLTIQGKDFWRSTRVKKGAKIGAGAMIKAGVVIGENAIIGLGAVVLKDVPAGEMWVGNPAKKLRKSWIKKLWRQFIEFITPGEVIK